MLEAGTHPLMFDTLLTHLRQQGFDLGVDHYLRLQELLNKSGAECAPENLKTLLCPIFATSEAQQKLFYHAFDSHFSLFVHPVSELTPSSAVEVGLTLPPREAREARDRSWLYLLAVAGLAVFTLLTVRWSTPKPEAETGIEAAQNTPQPQASNELQPPTQTIWLPRETIEPSTTPTPERRAQSIFYEESYLYKFFCYQVPQYGQRLYGLVTLWLAIFAPLLLFLFYDQPPRSARPRSKLYAHLRFISFWAALLTQPLLWLALHSVEELWRFRDSRAWLAILASLLFFLFYRHAPQDASPKTVLRGRLRAPFLVLAALVSLCLFLYGFMFHWAALCAPLIFLIIYEWRQYRQRQLLLQKQRGRKPPFVWSVRLKTFAPRLFDSELFYQTARLMRRRQADEHYQLDIDATVAATADALGYPTFRYKLATRPPEYLVLIDRASFRDHQAQLYNELAKALEHEGNFLVRYFYDADPRVCCDEAGGGCLSLVELYSKFAAHRLLVFGDGAGLLDPITGRLVSWTGIFADWSDRAMLTPAPPALWGFREVTLAGLLLVMPASLKGLLTLVTHFESLAETDVRAWSASSREKPPALDNELAEVVAALRAYLGEPTFQWLCACAVYPELHWDLTLYLGALPVMGGALIREENLLRLARLPWFRVGSIPDELRWLLLRELDPEKERAIRLAIIELLESDPPPRETYAADAYQLNLVVQRWLLRRDRDRRRDLLEALHSAPSQQLLSDYTLLRFLEAPNASALNVYLPVRLRNLFYRSGIPAFGLRTGARLTLVLLIIGVGLVSREYAQQFFRASVLPLSEAHARTTLSRTPAIANQPAANSCSACHTLQGSRADLTSMDANCAACHQTDAFVATVTPSHASAGIGCASCHTEHKGTNFRPDLAAISADFQPGVLPEQTCTGCHHDSNAKLYNGRRVGTPHGGTFGYPVANGEWTWMGLSQEEWARKPEEMRTTLARWPATDDNQRRSAQFHTLHLYRIKVPSSLRGNKDGEMSCSACHGTFTPEPDRISPRETCGKCHNGYVDPVTKQQVIAQDQPNCNSCHVQHVADKRPWNPSLFVESQQLSGASQPDISAFKPPDGLTKTVIIDAFGGPSDVYRDGQKVCTTPCPLTAPVGTTIELLLRRNGFKDTRQVLEITEIMKSSTIIMKRLVSSTESAFDFSTFMHGSVTHTSLACASCHQRAADNSALPVLPGHKACTDCHLAQFVEPNISMCNICHTKIETDNPPVKTFPSLQTFSTRFDHRQHNTGAARPANGCLTCHQISGDRVLSTVRGIAAHEACYTCHTPSAQYGGRDISSCAACHIRP